MHHIDPTEKKHILITTTIHMNLSPNTPITTTTAVTDTYINTDNDHNDSPLPMEGSSIQVSSVVPPTSTTPTQTNGIAGMQDDVRSMPPPVAIPIRGSDAPISTNQTMRQREIEALYAELRNLIAEEDEIFPSQECIDVAGGPL